MKPALIVLAAIMALVGLIWIFQGIGVIGGSFMTGQILWTYIGIGVLVAAAILVWFSQRSTKPSKSKKA